MGRTRFRARVQKVAPMIVILEINPPVFMNIRDGRKSTGALRKGRNVACRMGFRNLAVGRTREAREQPAGRSKNLSPQNSIHAFGGLAVSNAVRRASKFNVSQHAPFFAFVARCLRIMYITA